MPDWLPEMVDLASFNGDWQAYDAAAYETFRRDFVGVNIRFLGRRVGLKRHPVMLEREATFWHFVSSGPVEADRTPDLRRYERIGWPRAIIDNCTDASLKIWTQDVNNDLRIHVWCEEASYLLILADRGDFVLPWTAYPVEQPHRRRKLNEKHREYATNG